MENSYKFFENKECKYYPCHKGINELNCLFCYCPMYFLDKCLGNPEYSEKENGVIVKNCTKCSYPHNKNNYEEIMKYLSDRIKNAK